MFQIITHPFSDDQVNWCMDYIKEVREGIKKIIVANLPALMMV